MHPNNQHRTDSKSHGHIPRIPTSTKGSDIQPRPRITASLVGKCSWCPISALIQRDITPPPNKSQQNGALVHERTAQHLLRDQNNQDQRDDRNYNRDKYSHGYRKTGGPCFIATYAFGEDHEITWTLRQWRDEKLVESPSGRIAIQLYYWLSPKLISICGQYSWFKKLSVNAVSWFANNVKKRC